MNGWAQHFRRVTVALAGVAAMASIALAAPGTASAHTVAGTKTVSISTTSAHKVPTKHVNSWDW